MLFATPKEPTGISDLQTIENEVSRYLRRLKKKRLHQLNII
jgi:hypothetical protein